MVKPMRNRERNGDRRRTRRSRDRLVEQFGAFAIGANFSIKQPRGTPELGFAQEAVAIGGGVGPACASSSWFDLAAELRDHRTRFRSCS